MWWVFSFHSQALRYWRIGYFSRTIPVSTGAERGWTCSQILRSARNHASSSPRSEGAFRLLTKFPLSSRLNTQLVTKPKDLLEYVIFHEMIHLIEPTQSDRFLAILGEHYPMWREARIELNELPVSCGGVEGIAGSVDSLVVEVGGGRKVWKLRLGLACLSAFSFTGMLSNKQASEPDRPVRI